MAESRGKLLPEFSFKETFHSLIKCDTIQYSLIQIHFVFRDGTEHYFNDDEEPVDRNGIPIGCVWGTTANIPCKSVWTYKGKTYRFGECAPATTWGGPWCYDVRGAGYWGRCTVDSNKKPTCGKTLNDIMITIEIKYLMHDCISIHFLLLEGFCHNYSANNKCELFEPRNCVDDGNRLRDCPVNCGLCKKS